MGTQKGHPLYCNRHISLDDFNTINRLNFKIPIKEDLLIKLGTLVLQTGKLDLFDE